MVGWGLKRSWTVEKTKTNQLEQEAPPSSVPLEDGHQHHHSWRIAPAVTLELFSSTSTASESSDTSAMQTSSFVGSSVLVSRCARLRESCLGCSVAD